LTIVLQATHQNLHFYLTPFLEEAASLFSGFKIHVPEQGEILCRGMVLSAFGDLRALSVIMNTAGANSYDACFTCRLRGTYSNRRMVYGKTHLFLPANHVLRSETKNSFLQAHRHKHDFKSTIGQRDAQSFQQIVKDTCLWFTFLPYWRHDLFAFDYMHAVHNVMGQLRNWFCNEYEGELVASMVKMDQDLGKKAAYSFLAPVAATDAKQPRTDQDARKYPWCFSAREKADISATVATLKFPADLTGAGKRFRDPISCGASFKSAENAILSSPIGAWLFRNCWDLKFREAVVKFMSFMHSVGETAAA
jgi:hypothetical protein